MAAKDHCSVFPPHFVWMYATFKGSEMIECSGHGLYAEWKSDALIGENRH
jgi:hypothetical protein